MTETGLGASAPETTGPNGRLGLHSNAALKGRSSTVMSNESNRFVDVQRE